MSALSILCSVAGLAEEAEVTKPTQPVVESTYYDSLKRIGIISKETNAAAANALLAAATRLPTNHARLSEHTVKRQKRSAPEEGPARHDYRPSKAHKALGIPQDYICGYCGIHRTSASACSDGRIRIRCDCGGVRQDKVPRMHAHWKPLSGVRIYPQRMHINEIGDKTSHLGMNSFRMPGTQWPFPGAINGFGMPYPQPQPCGQTQAQVQTNALALAHAQLAHAHAQTSVLAHANAQAHAQVHAQAQKNTAQSNSQTQTQDVDTTKNTLFTFGDFARRRYGYNPSQFMPNGDPEIQAEYSEQDAACNSVAQPNGNGSTTVTCAGA